MVSMGVSDFVMTMALLLLVIGVIVLGFGIFTLVKRVLGKELNLIAEQTAKIAQKGGYRRNFGSGGKRSSIN